MGRAILSGILDSSNVATTNEASTLIPKKFIACVSGEESAQRIKEEFDDKVTLLVGNNVEGVKEADIVLLW
jgi:pyrroline-5-carboxylate reductase